MAIALGATGPTGSAATFPIPIEAIEFNAVDGQINAESWAALLVFCSVGADDIRLLATWDLEYNSATGDEEFDVSMTLTEFTWQEATESYDAGTQIGTSSVSQDTGGSSGYYNQGGVVGVQFTPAGAGYMYQAIVEITAWDGVSTDSGGNPVYDDHQFMGARFVDDCDGIDRDESPGSGGGVGTLCVPGATASTVDVEPKIYTAGAYTVQWFPKVASEEFCNFDFVLNDCNDPLDPTNGGNGLGGCASVSMAVNMSASCDEDLDPLGTSDDPDFYCFSGTGIGHASAIILGAVATLRGEVMGLPFVDGCQFFGGTETSCGMEAGSYGVIQPRQAGTFQCGEATVNAQFVVGAPVVVVAHSFCV